MLNGQTSMPITSLRYFIELVEEVGQTETPETYWQQVRSKANQLERQWLERHSRRCRTVKQRLPGQPVQTTLLSSSSHVRWKA